MSRLLIVLVTLMAGVPAAAQEATPDLRREAVINVLRAGIQEGGAALAEQHARQLRALDFDALPILQDLLTHNRVSTEAARALLALDERRAMAMIFAAIPRTDLSTQVVGFVWFLEHQGSLNGALNDAAYAAAQRVLARIESTAMAELALYTIGMVGSESDFPLLQEFAATRVTGTQGLRAASEAALSRLGSRPHLESLRAQLVEPLPAQPSYGQGMRLAQVLRQAAFSGNPTLIPAVCTHMADPIIGDIDVRIEPARIAANTLSLLLEPVTVERPRGAPRRSVDEWKTYCAQLP